ncbi:uncharacterized protein EKO05_0003686 [Ascochyta rabiei]|uniref:uncharacterized protein n=1 Tax=Didymella rabiei TaxID=5454 RepID=UPI00190067E3|nr:uncharacterized protein EKO05_0003686 [Ascochyta rabiei]UPX13160.1 hypothetical protein EKO05_0003686 [Ascochyta rabiei]
MPTYHARSITVRLGSMPLAETITSNIVLRKGEVAKRQCEAAEKKLSRSFLLDEKRVFFPGDPDGYELNWLGNAPFMQVQADGGFIQPSGLYASSYRSIASEDSRPQALSLHVKLSDKSFVSGLSCKTHLKIEVFFNGQLSTCSLVHTNDIRSGAKSLHQVFAGSRVDFLAERPWVILPPYTTADGGTRRFRKTITPSERWTQISDALRKESEGRGTNKGGQSPPSAEFLSALANMQMPETVKDMQKPGGRKLGVVDVVITAGIGSKLTAGINYLKSPQRLKDSDYTVRTGTRPKNKVATFEIDRTQYAKETPDLVDADADACANAEKDNDTLWERPNKRRALSPMVMVSQPILHNPDSEGLFPGMQIPYLSPPKGAMSRNDLASVTDRVSPRCPSPEHRSDGHKEPLPLTDCYRTYETKRESSKAQDWNSDASRMFQEYRFSSPNCQTSVPLTNSMHPNPLEVPSFDTTSRCEAFGGLSFITSTPDSSAAMQAFGDYRAYLPQLSLPSGVEAPVYTTTSSSPVSYVASTAWMHPATMGPSNATTRPDYYSTYLPQQNLLESYSSGLNRLPNCPPHTSPFFGYQRPARYAVPSTPPPMVWQSSGPLPPTAMFAVTSKPKQGASPTEDMTLIDLRASRPRVIVNRLVITGLNGKTVVDHRWKVAQHLIVNHDCSDEAIIREGNEALGSEHHELKAGSYPWKHGVSRSRRPRMSFPNKLRSDRIEQCARGQQSNNIQDGQAKQPIGVSLPYLRKHQGPENKILPANSKIDVPDMIAPFVSVLLPTTTFTPTPTAAFLKTLTTTSADRSTVAKRRTLSRNAFSGIQGPKAATFLLDDPEEVIREAAKIRRSGSPIKLANIMSIPSIMLSTQVGSPIPQADPGESSPLSSVPSSPLPERVFGEAVTTISILDQIPQLDGSPERTIPTASPHKLQTPSPTKSSFPTSTPQRTGLVMLQTPVSPESKKRKASHRSPTKPPRSPDRLKTVGNPPLNDDCVVAFAESEDKRDERGVLRQVKGERQGVFKEDYVVLAVRFFIAGD